jgi:hypothetical protein
MMVTLKLFVVDLSDCCLTLNDHFFSYIRGDDNDVRFVLKEHTYIDFYSTSALKQQTAGRHIIPIPRQPVFALSP